MHAASVELPTEFCAMDARQTTSSRTSSYWSISSVEPSTVPKARHAFLRSDRFPAKNNPARKLACDFDRPIFFFELRDRYVCSWCELYGSHSILVPTAHSHGHARRIHYPGDVTIVGRVTGVAMRIAELRESPTKVSPL